MSASARNTTPAFCPEWLDALNDSQREAVLAGLDSDLPEPLLVIAGAGTGKTHTLAHRVAALLAWGADPAAILLLTFSRRAALEMQRRVRRLLAQTASAERLPGGSNLPWSGTFHSVAARLLREYAGSIGLDPGFSIHDREDSADLMNLLRHQLGLSARQKRFPLKNTCLAIYSAVMNTSASLESVLQADFPWCREWSAELRLLYRNYVDAKLEQQVLDYDDLLAYWVQMLGDAALAAELGGRFRYVLVDEYQDTNPLQAAILRQLKPDGRGLTVVGDDAQAIYGFRGATVRNILDFPGQFRPPARRITLQQNYRSTPALLDAANAVIALSSERFEKNLWSARPGERRPRLVTVADDAAQADYVAERTLARRERGIPLKQQAVLFRASHHSARLELELTRRNIPYVKFGGLRFLEAAHVKDTLSLLRWGLNPRDRISGFRALQLLPGVGPKRAAGLIDRVAEAASGAEIPPSRQIFLALHADWPDFAERVMAAPDPGCWPSGFERLCDWYCELLPQRYDDALQREPDIRQLIQMAAGFADAERFLTEITLDPASASSGEAAAPLLDEDYLILSTIHSAKGQEWRAVTVLNSVDGCIPSDMATGTSGQIEEERRLLYVAMTRARESLDLMIPRRFHVTHQPALGDRHVLAGRTRFIPVGILDRFEQQVWPRPSPGDSAERRTRQAALDIAARFRELWR